MSKLQVDPIPALLYGTATYVTLKLLYWLYIYCRAEYAVGPRSLSGVLTGSKPGELTAAETTGIPSDISRPACRFGTSKKKERRDPRATPLLYGERPKDRPA